MSRSNTDSRAEIAARLGISPRTVDTRRRAGWSEERATSTPNQTGFRQPDTHPWKRRRFGRGQGKHE